MKGIIPEGYWGFLFESKAPAARQVTEKREDQREVPLARHFLGCDVQRGIETPNAPIVHSFIQSQ